MSLFIDVKHKLILKKFKKNLFFNLFIKLKNYFKKVSNINVFFIKK